MGLLNALEAPHTCGFPYILVDKKQNKTEQTCKHGTSFMQSHKGKVLFVRAPQFKVMGSKISERDTYLYYLLTKQLDQQ
jgi:hypothetical protein